jgi:TatD DNase family protein
MASDPIVAAVGETGLDYHYDNSPRAAQIESLRAHVAMAARVGKPLVIHCRDAYDDLERVLREESTSSPRGVVHCFTGTAAEARRMLDLGFALSFSGIVTFKNAASLREAARIVPADRLLVETDAPFLAPVPVRGRRCEPAFVVETARRLAIVRGDDLAELCAATVENARRFLLG